MDELNSILTSGACPDCKCKTFFLSDEDEYEAHEKNIKCSECSSEFRFSVRWDYVRRLGKKTAEREYFGRFYPSIEILKAKREQKAKEEKSPLIKRVMKKTLGERIEKILYTRIF